MSRVVSLGAEDPRPDVAKKAALFDFTYQTYESSAWIPQSLFDGNLVTQVVAGDIDTIVGDRVGLVLWRDNPIVPAFGMAPGFTSTGGLKWTVNCLVCHTAEIDGVAYFGAGTKLFDDLVLGESLKTLTSARWRQLLVAGGADAAHAADAYRILTSHHHDKIDSLTRARSTAFAASHVELFMRPNRGAMPAVDDVGRGDVKTPPLWHTAAKLQAGRWYSDGSFHGRIPLMASSMELEKDRSFDALVGAVIPRIKQEFDDVIRHLRPPPYPYAIDRALAAKGKELFYSREMGCSRCHDVRRQGDRRVARRPHRRRHRSLAPRRRLSGLHRGVRQQPDCGRRLAREERGLRRDARSRAWANYPHCTTAVPTLHHLLGPVSGRPAIFHVMGARRFDRERVGQRCSPSRRTAGFRSISAPPLRAGSRLKAARRAPAAEPGHDMWRRIKTDDNRKALIEYSRRSNARGFAPRTPTLSRAPLAGALRSRPRSPCSLATGPTRVYETASTSVPVDALHGDVARRTPEDGRQPRFYFDPPHASARGPHGDIRRAAVAIVVRADAAVRHRAEEEAAAIWGRRTASQRAADPPLPEASHVPRDRDVGSPSPS